MSQTEQPEVPPAPDTQATDDQPEVPDVSGLPVGGKGVPEGTEMTPEETEQERHDAADATADLPMGAKGRDQA
jgi:hypothetical protein